MPKLTPLSVAKLRPRGMPYEISDAACAGLRLAVFPSGKKSFIVRYRFRGLSRKLTLGPVLIGGGADEIDGAPELDTPLSLAAARELTTRALRQAKSGVDPAAEKRHKKTAERAADANTLQAVCDSFLDLVQKERPLRTIDQRRADLDLICETLGRLPLDSITKEQFVHQLDLISRQRGPVRSDRVLSAFKRLLSWYAGRRSNYVSVLAPVKRRTSITERARKRVLSDDELRRVWKTAETFPAPFGRYVKFLLLTGTRRKEAGGMARSELVAADLWRIPWQRLKQGAKSKTDLLVPLSKAAQAIIAARPSGTRPEGEFVFGGHRPLINFDYFKFKREFDAACGVTEPWTIHDLRRTARTLLGRLSSAGISADVAERCLGHAITGVRAHYDVHDYEQEKRQAFEALAGMIERIVHPPTGAAVADLAAERGKRRR